MIGVTTRRALLPALLLAAGCAGQAAPTTTGVAIDPQQVAALEQQVVDQAAQILELESTLASLQAALDQAEEEATWAAGRRELLARMLEDARAQLGSQGYPAQWIQEQFNAYQHEVESLRALVPMPDTPEVRAAADALVAFLEAMRDGDYAAAEALYGGSYEVLTDWNPTLDPSDEVGLLEATCTSQLRCELTVRRILGGLEVAEGWEFWIEFQDPEGQLWSSGPCCGSDTDPTVSQFLFVVAPGPEGPRVLTLPVYTP